MHRDFVPEFLDGTGPPVAHRVAEGAQSWAVHEHSGSKALLPPQILRHPIRRALLGEGGEALL